MKHQLHSHKLRKGRFSGEGQIYMITVVCYQRQSFFSAIYNGRCFVRAIRFCNNAAITLAYVVMPDHVHWLMQLESGSVLSNTVQKVKSLTTKNLRQIGIEHSKIWQKGFHDHALRREEDIKDIARYIVANPLRAGIVVNISDYPLWDAAWL
ncbi:MAG: transposase [Gammaproteobacteria bacterium]|nr:transposase [Gammaproteobacteria bacterium]